MKIINEKLRVTNLQTLGWRIISSKKKGFVYWNADLFLIFIKLSKYAPEIIKNE